MKKIRSFFSEMPKKAMSLLMIFSMIVYYVLPLTVVHADNTGYVVSFSATGTHTMVKDNGHLKIDGQYVDLKDGENNTIGEVNCESATSCSITVNDGTAGGLNYNSANMFTLYNTAGHTEYTMGTTINSNTVFMVENYAGGNNQNSNTEIVFDNATISGNVLTYNVNNTNVTLTVSGANLTNNKLETNRNDLANVSFTLGNTYNNDTMQVIVRGTNNYNQVLAVNNNTISLSGLNFPDGGLHIAIEPKTSGSNDNLTTANVTMTAGVGTYGQNRNYDADAEFYINGSMWNHGETIDYNVASNDTDVTFTFETLWINRFYEDIVINGTPYNVSNYLDFDDRDEWLTANHGRQVLSFDIPNVPKADSYNIVIKHGENTGTKYLATFLWTADPTQAGSHNYIGHSKLEFVKAVYEVAGTTYTVTEEDLEDRLALDDNNILSATSQDGFLNYGVTPYVDFDDGSLTLPGEAEITMRVVPEYGYQVTSVNGGSNYTTTDSGVSEFTMTIANGTAGYFQAEVTRVDDEVLANSDKVQSGSVEIANGDINSGTVRLSVDDIDLSADKITDFENYTGNDYNINSYLDINLNKVLYKGTADDVWSEQIHHLTNKALITLKLEEGVDVSNLVIVHNIDNGNQFEIIEIESYDPETNAITFYTDSFSNYAIATKTNNIASSAAATTQSSTSNPQTEDNIINYFIVLIMSFAGIIYTSLILNKRKKLVINK